MNLVVTNLLTAVKDPSRRRRWKNDPSLFAALRESVAAHGQRLIVLHDCLDVEPDKTTSFVRTPPGGNPYFARWRNIAMLLRRYGKVADLVWCVDATDVVMLHDPFPHMQPGAVYSGSEPRSVCGDTEHHEWLYTNHPSRIGFYESHPELLFMNPGILGGSAVDVLAACDALGAEPDVEMTDMGAWQQIAYDLFGDRIVTGHPVHTEYRALDHTNPEAWWAHK
ncbi:MAG TPA: hypothetical protein VGK49_02990 [Ilumatobacteraceae bacterium]